MKRKSILLKSNKVNLTETDRGILDTYLTNYEIYEFQRDENLYSDTADYAYDIEVELFRHYYHLEVFPNEIRTMISRVQSMES